MAAQQRRCRQLQDGPGDVVGVGLAEHAGMAVLDQRGRPALGDGDDGDAASARLEHHLPVGIRGRAEKEDVGAGVGASELLSLEPTKEGRVLAEAAAQLVFLRPTAGEEQVQSRVSFASA